MSDEMLASVLWECAWPDVPWADASPEDRRLYLNHAASLHVYWNGDDQP